MVPFHSIGDRLCRPIGPMIPNDDTDPMRLQNQLVGIVQFEPDCNLYVFVGGSGSAQESRVDTHSSVRLGTLWQILSWTSRPIP